MIINKNKRGFTLVELLVVIAIISILTVISASSYTSAQIKARDAQRKSDLDAVSKALMMYYNDTGVFPKTSDLNFGNVSVGLMGADSMVYMRQTPQDPKYSSDSTYQYIYKVSSDYKKFNLFANLENKKDSQCRTTPYQVDGKSFCYGLSSSNTVVDPSQF